MQHFPTCSIFVQIILWQKLKHITARLSAEVGRIYFNVRRLTVWQNGSDSTARSFHVLEEFLRDIWYLNVLQEFSSHSPASEEPPMRIPVSWHGVLLQLVLRLHNRSFLSNPKVPKAGKRVSTVCAKAVIIQLLDWWVLKNPCKKSKWLTSLE